MFRFSSLRFLIVIFISFTVAQQGFAQEDMKQAIFEKVFGDAVILDPERVEQVKTADPGVRHYFDNDGDGRPDEVWFIDEDLRHPEKMRPVLVRAIDEDGDLLEGHEPDLDSDLYVADWNADGVVDAVLDYTDVDGDNDIDEMGTYFWDAGGSWLKRPSVRVWWGRDDGDDNLLWFDVGYTYDQALCQYRTHFGGAETFVNFGIGIDDEEWTPFFENPFLFYDHDFDDVTEEVLRISGVNRKIEYLRHSFDADHDGNWDNPRDFDCSFSAHAHEDLEFEEAEGERIVLRGIPTGPFTKYRSAPEIVKGVVWKDAMLTWDENDHNVDGQRFDDAEERWEGVIAHGNDLFPQIGGPSCGPTNKRYELISNPSTPASFYYHPADQRIHLKGAEKGWVEVDFDMDRTVDSRYDLIDSDGDGYIDTWKIDFDADGTIDEEWTSAPDGVLELDWVWADVNEVIEPAIDRAAEQLCVLLQRLEDSLELTLGKKPTTDLGELIHGGFDNEHITLDLRRKYLSSNESLRYYIDLYKDLLIHHLRKSVSDEGFWKEFDALRSKGDLVGMSDLLAKQFPGRTKPLVELADWSAEQLRRIAEPRVAWAADWVPPNIGWESEKLGYRVYWGQFDFFGKKKDVLLYPTIGAVSYHSETEWGIDALLVGDSPGSGGLTLFVNGEPYPVWANLGESETKFEKQLVSESEESVTIRFTAAPVGPKEAPYTVTVECTAVAGAAYSPIAVSVEGGQPEDLLEIGVGFTRLPEEQISLDTETGVFGVRGFQDPAIGRIGMGLVFPKEKFTGMHNWKNQNLIAWSIRSGERSLHYIQCDWLRGVRFNVAPSLGDWMNELRQTASEVKVR